jgi:N-ethylmaleimide reductase
VTEAVHAHGGLIALQLWHVGRISHTSLQPNGQAPVAPSAVRAQAKTFTRSGFEDVSEPRALDIAEIPRVIEDYRRAARNAKEAGFDMVEVHAANGYLIDQFLQDNANRRTDAYGGPARNRVRFLREVVSAVADVWGAERVGVRLSPTGVFSDMADSNREDTFSTAYETLNGLGLAYLHVVERFAGSHSEANEALLDRLRPHWNGPYVANGDLTPERAREIVRSGRADAVTFGRLYIANPDLAARIRKGAALNEPDQSTFYGGDHRGYTDYPTLEQQGLA